MIDQVKLTVAILAGGKSSRMGVDKSFVLFQGRPMIEIVIERVTGLGDELILITNKQEAYAHLEVPMYGDIYPEHGSLGGIYTAVKHAAYPHTLVVACDMPWLNRSLLQHMISLREAVDVVVPRWHNFPEPLHAIYGKNCLEPMENNLKAGRLKIAGFYGRVRVRFLEQSEIQAYDPDGRSFSNINTRQELRDLE